MRCRCCNAEQTRRWKDEYYCSDCIEAIRETIQEDDQEILIGFEEFLEQQKSEKET